jgi:hypothetical protein
MACRTYVAVAMALLSVSCSPGEPAAGRSSSEQMAGGSTAAGESSQPRARGQEGDTRSLQSLAARSPHWPDQHCSPGS